MKNLYKLVLATILMVMGNLAIAGSCSNCTIESIGSGPNYDRLCPSGSCSFIRVNSTGGDLIRHSCSTDNDWHFVLDTSTSSGKSSLSQLLTAFTTGKTITIGGGAKCEIFSGGNSEDFDFIFFSW